MKKLTKKKVIKLLRLCVAERGEDFIYQTPADLNSRALPICLYVHDAEPGCIVGLAMHKAGVPLDALRAWDRTGTIGPVIDSGLVPFLVTDKAREALSAAQAEQDDGRTWGAALAAAEVAGAR